MIYWVKANLWCTHYFLNDLWIKSTMFFTYDREHSLIIIITVPCLKFELCNETNTFYTSLPFHLYIIHICVNVNITGALLRPWHNRCVLQTINIQKGLSLEFITLSCLLQSGIHQRPDGLWNESHWFMALNSRRTLCNFLFHTTDCR